MSARTLFAAGLACVLSGLPVALAAAAPAPVAPQWQAGAAFAGSELTQGRGDWYEEDFNLRRSFGDKSAVTFDVDVTKRFAHTDVYFEGRYERPQGDAWFWYAGLGGTLNANYRAQIAGLAGGTARLSQAFCGLGPTILTVDARVARYPTSEVVELDTGLQQYTAQGQAWATLRLINVATGGRFERVGYSLRGDLFVSDDLRLFAGYADAPDTSDGITALVRSGFGGAAYALSDTATLQLSLAQETRQHSYSRTTLAVGLSVKF